MLNFNLYAIYVENITYSGIKEFFKTFDEAKVNCFNDKYKHWFDSGKVWIKKYKANDIFKPCHEWRFTKDGNLIEEYEW